MRAVTLALAAKLALLFAACGQDEPIAASLDAGSGGKPDASSDGPSLDLDASDATDDADVTSDTDADAPPSGALDCPDLEVTTLSGNGTPGFVEGSGGPTGLAEFHSVRGVAMFATVLSFAADRDNNVIRKVLLNGEAEGVFGSGVAGYLDANGEGARFAAPEGVAADALGAVLVADTGNHRIRRIAPSEDVTTLAGTGNAGLADGTAADFHSPRALSLDDAGDVWVADTGNHAIRSISPAGLTTTVAGDGTAGFVEGKSGRLSSPSGVLWDGAGVLVADTGNGRIRKLTLAGELSTLAGNGDPAVLGAPFGIARDPLGNVYVSDPGNHRLVLLRPDGSLTAIAGDGTAGYRDGRASDAWFGELAGIAYSVAHAGGALLVADGNRIRIVYCP